MKIIFNLIKSFLLISVLIICTNNSKKIEAKVVNDNPNKMVNLSLMAMKLSEYNYNNLYSAKETLTGDLTGYVYNCPACTGRLACLSSLDLSGGLNTYTDEEYGLVNIVASSTNLPCGSIIRFDLPKISDIPIYAIVLDRGVLNNDIDFLSEDYNYAVSKVGRATINYDVLRRGFSEKVAS